MHYRRFGRTGLQMPVLSCGGMRYQYKWEDVPPADIPKDNQANLEATIHAALAHGINHIETARGYGSSEMQLGQLLPNLPREKLIVQTKVAPFASRTEFLRTFKTSMDYLKLDHVDLLSFHGINTRQHLDWTLKPGGCLDAARQIQREGRARFIGFSTHATPDIILDTVKTGEFDYVNLHWYFVNHLNWASIEEATRLDMGVFIISPADKGGKLYDPPRKLTDLCQPLSPIAFNNLYCLSQPQVHTLSVGAAKPSDFDEHILSLNHLPQAREIIPPIESRLRSEMESILGRDWCQTWHHGIPEYIDLPGNLNIVEILRLWSYAKSLDLVAWGKMRYNLLGNADHWFPGHHLGQLQPDEINSIPAAVANSPFAARIPGILQEAHDLLHDAPKQRLSKS